MGEGPAAAARRRDIRTLTIIGFVFAVLMPWYGLVTAAVLWTKAAYWRFLGVLTLSLAVLYLVVPSLLRSSS